MNEKERNNRRVRDEVDNSDNAYMAEQEAADDGKIAEKAITATIQTGLKIGEAKEKLVISKESKKLQTDRKSVNFHSEKRNSRFQVDRLSEHEDSDINNEDTDDNDDNEAAETDTDVADNAESVKSDSKEEIEPDGKANTQSKKTAQRKMRERLREQRQRTFSQERHKPENNQLYDNDSWDFEDFEDYTDIEPDNPTIDKNANSDTDSDTDMDFNHNKTIGSDNENSRKTPPRSRNEERITPLKTNNPDTPRKFIITKKTHGLKQEKSDIKLKTDKKENTDITLNKAEDKLNRKKQRLRKRQRNNLTTQKYNLKKAKLAHASAVSKLIVNSAETPNNQSTIHVDQNHTGQGRDYAEQEQTNLNKNLVDTASTGLKSIITDFKTFEANLFSDDKDKSAQKEFNKRKQWKTQYIKKKAETAERAERAEESKRQSEKPSHNQSHNQNNKSLNDVKNAHTDNTFNESKGDYTLGDKNGAEYNLKKQDDNNALNKRDNDKSGNSLNRRKSTKRENPNNAGAESKNTNGGKNTQSEKSGKSLTTNTKRETTVDKTTVENKRPGNKTTSTRHDNVSEDNNGKRSSSKNASTDAKNTSADAKDTKVSRLKHDKPPTNRKGDTTAETSSKLKFNKENRSWHEHKEEKLRRDKNKSKPKGNVSPAAKKDKEKRKILQKKNNKKVIQKRAMNNQKKASEKALQFSKKAGKATAKQILAAAKFVAGLVVKKIIALVLFLITKLSIAAVAIIIPVIIIAVVGLVLFGTAGTMLLTSYLADDETLTQATVYYSDRERDLIDSLTENAIKSDYNVDEVNFIFVDNIGHNPHFLLSYLTAKFQNFTFDQVQGELDTIFGLQYTKTVVVRSVNIPILDADGEPTGNYTTRRIADVTLTNNGFYDILYSRLSSDEREHFLLILETMGNRQYGNFPMSWDWLINITEDFNNSNNGVEAEVPVNTAVYGTINGEIVATTADSVSIQGSTGEDTIIITFSRLNIVTVNVGDSVGMATVVGYTSDRIFIQIQRNGIFVNPVLFLGSQRQDLVYGTAIPPLTQSEFNTLRDFASAAIGTPYVFGGNGPPPHGIDCSGFVWWAINGSEIKTWGRTTAQGQFNQCDPITLADARPGDLIFFQGTYDTRDSRIVTHVGIYLGNGQMQHSGSPNEITSIHTAYWQRHFYSFGRLRR